MLKKILWGAFLLLIFLAATTQAAETRSKRRTASQLTPTPPGVLDDAITTASLPSKKQKLLTSAHVVPPSTPVVSTPASSSAPVITPAAVITPSSSSSSSSTSPSAAVATSHSIYELSVPSKTWKRPDPRAKVPGAHLHGKESTEKVRKPRGSLGTMFVPDKAIALSAVEDSTTSGEISQHIRNVGLDQDMQDLTAQHHVTTFTEGPKNKEKLYHVIATIPKGLHKTFGHVGSNALPDKARELIPQDKNLMRYSADEVDPTTPKMHSSYVKRYNPGSLSAVDMVTQEYSQAITDRSIHLRDSDKSAGAARSTKHKAKKAGSSGSVATKKSAKSNKTASK